MINKVAWFKLLTTVQPAKYSQQMIVISEKLLVILIKCVSSS